MRLLQGPLAFVSLRGGWVHELQSLGAASCAGGRFQPVDVGPSAGPQAPSRGTLRGILRGPRSVTLHPDPMEPHSFSAPWSIGITRPLSPLDFGARPQRVAESGGVWDTRV